MDSGFNVHKAPRRAAVSQVTESQNPKRLGVNPLKVPCPYCGAAVGESCTAMAAPVTVSQAWAHRAREAAVSRG